MTSPSENPFSPPGAALSDAPEVKPGSPVKAILIGLVVDIGGTLATGILIGIAYAVFLAFNGVPGNEMVSAFDLENPMSPYSLTTQALGFACSILGGYACARIVKRDEYRTAAIMAALSATFGLFIGDSKESAFLVFALTALSIFFNLLGAKLGRAENRRAQAG
jgi:hypothetical protein